MRKDAMRAPIWHYALATVSIASLAGCMDATTIPPKLAASQPLAQRPATMTQPTPPARACTDDVVRQLLTPAAQDPTPVLLTCRAVLPPKSTVTRQIVFEGGAASGSGIDCKGGRLEGTAQQGGRGAVIIRSKKKAGTWSRPVDITVRNCEISTGLRIYGLGVNGEAPGVKESSMNANHTTFAQSVAPTAITLDKLRFVSSGGIPLYISPGVTNVTVSNSRFTGTSTSVALYLDAESGGATIINNVFDLRTDKRELIAVDGSAYNSITGNSFNTASNGGIFVYRNCGEGGTIRHQAPQFNDIEKNVFAMGGSGDPAVWLNSRNGNRNYCFTDPNHPYGSGLTSLDMAQHNIVKDNEAKGSKGRAFRNSDPTNNLSNNVE